MLKTLSSFIQDARFIALTQSILGALLRAIALARLKRQCLGSCESLKVLNWLTTPNFLDLLAVLHTFGGTSSSLNLSLRVYTPDP